MLVESKIGPNHDSPECHTKMFILHPDGNKEPLKGF